MFTYNNYSRVGPIKQGFDFKLKTNNTLKQSYKNDNKTLLYLYFILSNPSLSIKNNDRFCRFGLTGKDDINDETISFVKRYLIFNESNTTISYNSKSNEDIEFLETGITEEFLFNEIGVKEFYFYYCFLSNEENEEKM